MKQVDTAGNASIALVVVNVNTIKTLMSALFY